MAEHHELMGGKLHVYKRENSSVWQCSTYLAGKNWRVSTKEESLSHAKEIAEDWYLGLKGKARNNELKVGKTFKQVADHFVNEYEVLTLGERNPDYVKSHGLRLRVHLLPFFGEKVITEINPGMVQEYRVHRMTSRKDPKTGEPVRPARTTLHHEIITLRHVLKTAHRNGWLPYLPDISAPYKTSGKIAHRAWFTLKEYEALYKATGDRIKNPRHNRGRWKWECEQLHDFVLFMVNTGLRPDEARNIQFRDVEIVGPEKEEILEISVRGKRGVGYCKSMPGAVEPFRRLLARQRPHYIIAKETRKADAKSAEAPKVSRLPLPTEKLFPNSYRELLNDILEELGLKFDREGQVRTAYSLRHTYICLRLMQGADIYQIAKNCRTSVEMIEKFYASHIKDIIDASAVNVMKPKPKASKRPDGRVPQRPANAKGARTRRDVGDPKNRH